MALTVSIIEDDPVVRASWVKVVNRIPGYRCLSDFPTAETAIEGLPKNPPDFVLMDIDLPGKSGIECTRELKRLVPKTEIVMLTMFGDRCNLFEALGAGAIGYLLKRTTSAALAEAFEVLREGGSPMSPQIARQVVQFFRKGEPEREAEALEVLSERENEIVRCLARGLAYQEIATLLQISIGTLRTYIRRAYEKLHVHSRTEAVVKYLKR